MFGSRGGSGFGSVRGTTFEELYFEFDLIWVIDTTLPRRRFKSFHPENMCAKNREGVELRSLLGRFWEWMVWSKEGGHSWWNIL